MARLFHDGFETGRPSGNGTTTTGGYNDSLWQFYMSNVGSGLSIGTTASGVRSGTYSLRYYQTGSATTLTIRRNLGAVKQEIYCRAYVYISEFVGTNQFFPMYDEAGTLVASLGFSGAASLVDMHLYVGTSQVATLSNAFALGTWVRLEWRLVVDNTTGVFQLKRNGDTVLTFNGDTKGASSGNGVQWFGIGKPAGGSNNASMRIDDVAINDTTGTINNSWCGPGSILLLKPKGAGNYTQWTPDSGNNFARVNEIPHTSDSAYVESDTADEIDTYEMQTLTDLGVDTSDPAFNIKAVQHVMAGRWDEAETELSRVLRLGATDDTGVAVVLTNTYNRYWDEMFDVNPFDSLAWELDDLNALEAGVKHIAAP